MDREYPYGKGPVRLVSSGWLAERLDEPITILDVQPNIHDYIQEHIPGAIYLDEGIFRGYCGRLPTCWVPPGAIEPVLRNAGIRADSPIVVYTGVGVYKGWGDGLEQTMTAYSLARYGCREVLVLDGGLDKWKAEGKPLSKEYPSVGPSDFRAAVQTDFYIEYEEFTRMKDRPDVLLLDARPPDVYEGQGPWGKPGHIPGAVSLPWASLMHETNKALLKPDGEIRDILRGRGVTPDKKIICSCGTGREATNEFLLLRCYLGFPDVKNHEGAFTEWASYPENPTVTGKNPR